MKRIHSSALASVIAVIFVVMTIYYYWYQSFAVTAHVIDTDIAQLVTIFKRIDKDCKIISFDSQQNPINFLNVRSFTSSEVGPMNLMHPVDWQGPYVKDNLTVQGIEYMVVRTDHGYFITPGKGVRLPNGKIIGKDIIVDEHADIASMISEGHDLFYNGKRLAAELKLS